jgi:hypothetical protein
MICPEVRDWSPEVLDIQVNSESFSISLRCREDMEVRTFLGQKEEFNDILEDIQDLLEVNKDRIPADFNIPSFVHMIRCRSKIIDLLTNGQWLKVVMEALDEVIAGEDDLKKVLLYSGLSAGLKGKLHVYVMGDSQMGKTHAEKNIGSMLFPDRFLLISTMSGKACYGKAMQDPEAFRGKILCLDEMNDLSLDAKAMVKAMASNETEELTQYTLDDRRAFQEKKLRGMPVIWTNSMETLQDQGNQIANRFFKPAIDGSEDQDRRVETFQRNRMSFGRTERFSEKAGLARALIHEIMMEEDFAVLNPFTGCITLKEGGPRNRLPMFESMLASITYANRFRRSGFIDSITQTRFLFSTIEDNEEAARLYASFAETQDTAIAPRLLEVLQVLSDTEWMHPEVIAQRVNAARIRGRNPISAATCYNYLRELSNKDLVSSTRESVVSPVSSEERRGRSYVYRRIRDMDSIASPQISVVDPMLESFDLLADYLDALETAYPQLYKTYNREQFIKMIISG